MRRVVLLLACLWLTGCADSRLTFDQRAYIQCRETGGDDRCPQNVRAAWNDLYAACSARSSAANRCNAEFERRYWCRVTRIVEKFINERGETSTRETTSERGPGCMESYERSRVKNEFRDDCLAGAPAEYEVEGARCGCGDYGCSVTLPFFFDNTVSRYFPNL